MSVFHHGRFDVPRGKLVPRDEDADDDGLAIFEGPGVVPLSALAWLLTTVDEPEEKVARSVWYITVRKNDAPALETPLTATLARMDARVPRTPRTPLVLRGPTFSLFSRSSRSASSRIVRSSSSLSLRSFSLCAASTRSSSSRRRFSSWARISSSSSASSLYTYIIQYDCPSEENVREHSTASAPIHRSSKMSCLTRSDLDRILMYLLSNASVSSSCFATRLCRMGGLITHWDAATTGTATHLRTGLRRSDRVVVSCEGTIELTKHEKIAP